MSYIPKYILKRMFKKDCVKKVEDGVEIEMINVISPLSIEDGIPEDPWNSVDIRVDGKNLDVEAKKQATISVEDNTYSVAKAKEFEGVVIPVGEKVKLFLPVEGIEAGEEHEFEVVIQTDNPFQIKVKREVQ